MRLPVLARERDGHDRDETDAVMVPRGSARVLSQPRILTAV